MEYVYCFLIAGAICLIGQLLIDGTKLTAPRVLVLMVVMGAILQGFGLYQPLVDLAGQGATVPLPGFGYALTKGALEAAQTEGFLGVLKGAISSTSAGVCVSIGFGYLVALAFNPKSPR